MTEVCDLEYHHKQVQRHCRVCAANLDQKYAYTCKKEKNKPLLKMLGIDVDEDQLNVHPTLFCQSCRTKATQLSDTVKSSLSVFDWKPHTDPSSTCEIC